MTDFFKSPNFASLETIPLLYLKCTRNHSQQCYLTEYNFTESYQDTFNFYLPCKARGIASIWILVGFAHPNWSQASHNTSVTPLEFRKTYLSKKQYNFTSLLFKRLYRFHSLVTCRASYVWVNKNLYHTSELDLMNAFYLTRTKPSVLREFPYLIITILQGKYLYFPQFTREMCGTISDWATFKPIKRRDSDTISWANNKRRPAKVEKVNSHHPNSRAKGAQSEAELLKF